MRSMRDGLDLDNEASIIAHAEGAFGSSLDYLERTRVALVTHGIVDPYLETLAAKVMRYAAPGPDAARSASCALRARRARTSAAHGHSVRTRR